MQQLLHSSFGKLSSFAFLHFTVNSSMILYVRTVRCSELSLRDRCLNYLQLHTHAVRTTHTVHRYEPVAVFIKTCSLPYSWAPRLALRLIL
jgi:hypothetical protein